MSELNHQILERDLGGGYVYEWILGAELALLALLPEHQTAWLCERTETPILHNLRCWLGPVKTVTLEARGKDMEDINLHGVGGRVLMIQVKSGKKRLDTSEYLKVLNRFADKETDANSASRRYLLVVEDGITISRHLSPTLSEYKDKDSDLAKVLKGRDQKYLVDDRTFPDRIYFSRGPLIERLVTGLRNAVGGSVSRVTDRKQLLSLTDTYSNRFKERAVTSKATFTETGLRALLDRPTTLAELIQRWGLSEPKSSDNPVYLLDQLLEWELAMAGVDIIEPLVRQASQKRVQKGDNLRRALDDIATSLDFPQASLRNFADCEIRALCLRRMIAALSGELSAKGLHARAGEGDELALAHLWFGLGVEIERHDQVVTIRVRGCEGYTETIKHACRSALIPYAVSVGDHLISKVVIEIGDPVGRPDWMPQSEWQELGTRPSIARQALSPENVETSERAIAREVADLEVQVHLGEPEKHHIPPLESILERCREQNLLRLTTTAGETLAVALEATGRSDDAIALRLNLALDELSQVGSQLYFRQNEGSFSKFTRDTDERAWLQVQLGKVFLAAMRSDLKDATRICGEVDSAAGRRLDQPNDDLVFQILFAHAQAAMVSGLTESALEAGRSLLHRLPEDSSEQLCETLIFLTLCAMESDEQSGLVSIQNLVQRFSSVSAQLPSRLDLLKVLQSYLDWMVAPSKEARDDIAREWSELAATLSDDRSWSLFYRLRAYFQYRRGIIHFRPEAQRRGAWEVASRQRQPEREAVNEARDAFTSNNLHSSLHATYKARFLSLRTGEWNTWQEASQLLPRLYLADGMGSMAAQSYILHGVGGTEKDFLTDLVQKFPEEQSEDVVESVLEAESPPRRARGFGLLGRLKDVLDDGQRARVIAQAEQSLKTVPELREQANAQNALFDLIGEFLQCPSDKDEAVRLIRVLLKRYHSHDDPSRKSETLKKIRRTFWTATGLLPPDGALDSLLDQLESALKSGATSVDRGLIFDILLAIALARDEESVISSRCLSLLREYQAKNKLAEWKARSDKPSVQEAKEALAKVQATLRERIEHRLDGATSSLRRLSLGDIMPFLDHLEEDDLTSLLSSLLTLAADGESESTRRWEALQLLRHPAFHRCSNGLLVTARRLVADWIDDRIERNLFDKHRAEVNSSSFSGLSLDVDHDDRVLQTAFEALGSLHAPTKGCARDTYLQTLAIHLASPNPKGARNASRSLICYFECKGSVKPAYLNHLLLSLVQRFSAEDKADGLVAAGKFVRHGGQPSGVLISLVRAFATNGGPVTFRKSLASFSRMAVKGDDEHPGKFRAFYRELNNQMRGDRLPIVRRYADLKFWRDRV